MDLFKCAIDESLSSIKQDLLYAHECEAQERVVDAFNLGWNFGARTAIETLKEYHPLMHYSSDEADTIFNHINSEREIRSMLLLGKNSDLELDLKKFIEEK